MMRPNSPSIVVALETDAQGVIRIKGTRVTLATLIIFYRQGENPDTLHQNFPIIAFYLANQAEIDAHLEQVAALCNLD